MTAIRQIIPADGWGALYLKRGSGQKLEHGLLPLTCWALISDDENGDGVVGIRPQSINPHIMDWQPIGYDNEARHQLGEFDFGDALADSEDFCFVGYAKMSTPSNAISKMCRRFLETLPDDVLRVGWTLSEIEERSP